MEEDFNEIEQCAEYICAPQPIKSVEKNVTVSCPHPKCPDNYEIELDNSNASPGECQKYSCVLRPQKDDICEISGKSISTFDGTEYKYDTCSHVLARGLANSSWVISVHLHCIDESRKICRKMITIKDKQSQAILSIRPDLKLNFNGFDYTVQQLIQSPTAKDSFIISQLGNTILIVSRNHGFWVSYDEVGLIRIGVSSKFIKTIDGLCGYYNDNPLDDKRMPDGSIATSTAKFGDSWFDKSVPKEHCYAQVCPRELQMKSLALCNTIKHPTFLKCGKAVNYKRFVSKCVETTCECLQANEGNTNVCKCSILQGFVKQCLAVKPNVQLDTWRAVHQCEISCPAPLVHSDCYKRRCEPSCESINGDDCPVLPDACFSGCYCPEGTVRKGQTCAPVAECKDCVCDSFGTSKYVTYDRKNFTFSGNCTYLLSRDIVLPGVHTFQVYVTMDDCKKLGRIDSGNNSSCTKSLHILHGDHVIHIQRAPDSNKALQVFVDGLEVKKLPYKDSWIGLRTSKGKEMILTLPESNVDISSSFDDLSFSIGVPSIKYGGKMEGLCGDCDGDAGNDLKMNPQKVQKQSNEIMDIVHSWQADEPKLGIDPNECLSEEIPLETCIPLPPELDPCMKFFDENLFGKCQLVVDPIMYVSSCQQDMCKPGNDQRGACESLNAYSRECARKGICLDWRSANLCPYECPPEMVYKSCGCTKTCETIKETNEFDVVMINTNKVVKTMTVDEMCSDDKSAEGCFCPPGKVQDGNQCVTEEQCVKCDEPDHRPGDIWKKDKCTECTCSKDGKTECLEQKCSVQESVCSEGFTPTKISSSEECCPRYICLPEPKKPPPITCPDAPLPECGPGQFKKQKTGSDGCPQFICECKPTSECDPLVLPPLLKPGEKVIQDTTGCCPLQKIICDKTTCPPAPKSCEKEFYDVTTVMFPGDCCPTHICTPPKDACIVSYENAANGKFLKKLGDKWLHPHNPCVQEFCAYGPNDTVQIITTIEECDTKCPFGFTYTLSDAKTKCCGDCSQTECVFDGKLYKPHDKWQSPDKCTEFACIEKDGHLIVSSLRETCPDVSDCPIENLLDDGCCKACKKVPESMKNCLPMSLAESETINLIKVNLKDHGYCMNTEPIRGFTECSGSCESGSRYNAMTYTQDKLCNCCSIDMFKTIKVPLVCEDDYQDVKDIEIPSACSCSPCTDSLQVDARMGPDIKK